MGREIYPLDHILIDMESYFVLLSQSTFTNDRLGRDLLLESSPTEPVTPLMLRSGKT